MKLTKLSLVAALLVGSSVFAVENTKVSGDAKLYYLTDDSGVGLFNKDTAYGQAALGLGATADLSDTVKGSAHLTALSSLGLENQLVMNVWEGTNGTDDSYWFDTLNISANMDKTNLTVGRMKLDTPLVWTETWSIAYNTFEAAVVTNKDIENTTIVAAYVGGSNGAVENAGSTGWVIADMNANGNTNFSQFYNGAYTVGVLNNSWKPLNVQAWYYNATSVLDAYWIQADLEMDGIQVGAQYVGGESQAGVSNSAFALKVGYEIKDTFSVAASYSQTGQDDASSKNLSGAGYSKLYTESWWTAIAGNQDTQTMNLTLTAPVADYFDAAAYIVSASDDTAIQNELFEATFEASKSFGKLDALLVYVYTDADTAAANTDAVNTIIVNLAYNF